jgi:hypothetical protein
MNKAFVKEPDHQGGFCPRCGSLGSSVGRETIAALVRPDTSIDVADPAFFCGFARCEVVYFDEFDRVLTVDQMQRPIWPKDPTAPLCGCFGLTADDVERDVREGGVARVKAVVQKSAGPEADCIHRSADGKSCAAEVQRYYFKLRGSTGG